MQVTIRPFFKELVKEYGHYISCLNKNTKFSFWLKETYNCDYIIGYSLTTTYLVFESEEEYFLFLITRQ